MWNEAWWLVAGGWWLVAGGWWLVAGGWWLVAGGWWLLAVEPSKYKCGQRDRLSALYGNALICNDLGSEPTAGPSS